MKLEAGMFVRVLKQIGKITELDDEIYNVDIHIWRTKGMGNSLQTIVGNEVSIFTATTSYLQTLLNKEVLTIEQLKDMVELAIKGHKGEL